MSNFTGKAIRETRKFKKHSLKEAAKAIGVCSDKYLSLIERGYKSVKKEWNSQIMAYLTSDFPNISIVSEENKDCVESVYKKKPPLIQRLWAYDKKRHDDVVVGFIVADEVTDMPGYVSIGISVCHRFDKFNAKVGRRLAFSRVQTSSANTKFRNHMSASLYFTLEEQCVNFIWNRCMKYYKDKKVIMPKSEFYRY